MGESELLPDHLRCHRTDGRQWRCKRPSLAGKKLCEVHHLQGLHRQHKEKVPDSLKIQRKACKKSKPKKNREDKTLEAVQCRRENVGPSEALDGALKKMKLKRGDLHLELIRVFLKRRTEKNKERELRENNNEERDLPNGLMEISPGQNVSHANNFCNIKLGFDPSSVSTRHFRSKNIEPIPISKMQVLPFARGVIKSKKKKRKYCHWCRKTSYCSLIQCSSCKKEYFCTDCILERSSMTEEQVKVECPVCQRTCRCRSCLKNQSEDFKHKDCLIKETKVRKIRKLRYLICMLLPVLKRVILEHRAELAFEAELKGQTLSELQIQVAESHHNKLYTCNNCRMSIVDLHRSCKNCSCNFCLHCSKSFRSSSKASLSKCHNKSKPLKSSSKIPKMNKVKKTSARELSKSSALPKWKACDDDGNVICPPMAFGGCEVGLLGLRRVLPFGWAEELESRAEDMVRDCDLREKSVDPSLCKGMESRGIKASSRDSFEDNFLYHLKAEDIRGEKLQNFQKHWGKGHPVIVCRAFKSKKDIIWDPLVLFCSYLEKKRTRLSNNGAASKTQNCLDWCELEICRKQIFMGSLGDQALDYMRDETMKLKLWLSSSLFREQFTHHHAEIFDSLPLKEYMNPTSGFYNLASDIQQGVEKPNFFGPSIHISFGGPRDFMGADFVTKLFCASHDVVNILVHTTDVAISAEELRRVKNLMKKYNNTQDHGENATNATDQKMEHDSEDKSSVLSGNSEESSLQNNIEEGLNLSNGVEHDRESDSEPSIRWSGTFIGSEESDDQKIFQNYNKISDYLGGDDGVADPCGAQWDVFHRQDVPKLVEYLSRHSNEFGQSYDFPKNVVHPIHDQCFYLDTIHKIRLKEEFNIEPWTFKQHLGEAVIVPAGCPYQIRHLQSCVNIDSGFISPESAAEAINLADERRMLPVDHKARKNLTEVQKIALNRIHEAVDEIRKLLNSD